VQSPCDPLKEDYTQIFYIIDKEDILSFEYKFSLRGLKFMKKVNGSHHVSIALRPHCSFLRI
jgi:hypothetical protein